jgi:hypothetical protein
MNYLIDRAKNRIPGLFMFYPPKIVSYDGQPIRKNVVDSVDFFLRSFKQNPL